MLTSDFHRLVLDTAQQSKAKKRKVGAVAISLLGDDVSAACNQHPENLPCELADGTTDPKVIHAEVAVIKLFKHKWGSWPALLYVTQPPCADCLDYIQEHGNPCIEVVEEFMKFDSSKLRYDLVPVSAGEGLAKVITYGARKYKPDNWRKGEADRYYAALERHLQAWRKGEKVDEESGLLHLEHALCNVSFLLELDGELPTDLDPKVGFGLPKSG